MNIRLRANDNHIEVGRCDPSLIKTILHRQGRARSLQTSPLLANEALFLHGSNNAIAVQQAGGAIVGGTEPKDPGFIGGGHSCLLY
jgi:hypothetical protein